MAATKPRAAGTARCGCTSTLAQARSGSVRSTGSTESSLVRPTVQGNSHTEGRHVGGSTMPSRADLRPIVTRFESSTPTVRRSHPCPPSAMVRGQPASPAAVATTPTARAPSTASIKPMSTGCSLDVSLGCGSEPLGGAPELRSVSAPVAKRVSDRSWACVSMTTTWSRS